MADILELIKSRRNVKHFIPKFVSWENISRVLDAGRHAPSCGNIQNWKFLLILKPEQKEQIAKIAHEQYEMANAAVLIVVCAEPEKAERYFGSKGMKLFSVQNCAAAVQTMLLEAESLGLASQWVGAFDEDELKEALKIPTEVSPQAIVALGYAKEVPPKPPKYPLESLIYFGSWRNRLKDPAKYMNDVATILARKAHTTSEAIKKGAEYVLGKAKDLKDKK